MPGALGYLAAVYGVLVFAAAFGRHRHLVHLAVLGGLFVLTGSLWAPILLHAIVDFTSGTIARRAFASSDLGEEIR